MKPKMIYLLLALMVTVCTRGGVQKEHAVDDTAKDSADLVYLMAEAIDCKQIVDGGLHFELNDDGETFKVKGLIDSGSTEVVIPAFVSVNGVNRSVTIIGKDAFFQLFHFG